MNEPPWKKLKLSLERPYKYDNGDFIPTLLDITPDGRHIYEPKDDHSNNVAETLRRIFTERGADFFESSDKGENVELGNLDDGEESNAKDVPEGNTATGSQAMTAEEWLKMRADILPQLHVALGEMSQGRDLLSLLLASTSDEQSSPVPALSSTTLAATVVTNPPPIHSVHAFNAQLVIGGKDSALRKAADLFKSAANHMEKCRSKNDRYWEGALKIRGSNWRLVPAPLPPGSATGKGADKTSRDFEVSFGLEEAPSYLRRRAVGHMVPSEVSSSVLSFPNRRRVRLRVTVISDFSSESPRVAHNRVQTWNPGSLNVSLKAAQQEIVEEEIFSVLIAEASELPTAAVRVSERLIVIEAAQTIELRFELVEYPDLGATNQDSPGDHGSTICDLIYASLHVLLLNSHAHAKAKRLINAAVHDNAIQSKVPARSLLHPIISLLQYYVFRGRVKAEVDRAVGALRGAGIPSRMRFTSVGESGGELVGLLNGSSDGKIGGEAILRIDDRHTLRLTFLSPSLLTAHLPQATLSISSISQLRQLLIDEIERCTLNRICELGTNLCTSVSGIWIVDLVGSRTVGRWEECVMNFRVSCHDDFTIDCSAFRFGRGDGSTSTTYRPLRDQGVSLLAWAKQTIQLAFSRRDHTK